MKTVSNGKFTIHDQWYWAQKDLAEDDNYFDTLEEAIEAYKRGTDWSSHVVIAQKICEIKDMTIKVRDVEVQ